MVVGLTSAAGPAPGWGRVRARAYEPDLLVTRVRELRGTLGA